LYRLGLETRGELMEADLRLKESPKVVDLKSTATMWWNGSNKRRSPTVRTH